MKTKQKIVALLGMIFVLLLYILPLATYADVIGNSGLITGWYLEGTLNLYDSGPDIWTQWGGNDPWFSVIDQLDNYTNITRSTDSITYSDYSAGVDSVTYSIYPKFNNSVVNMATGDSLLFNVYGSFGDITNGDEFPYLRIFLNRTAYIIKSYTLEFSYWDDITEDYEFYTETRSNWYRSDFVFDAAFPEIQGFALELEIISQTSYPGNLRILIDHSVRDITPVVDEDSYYAGYNDGYSAGIAAGSTEGYRNGYDAGVADATADVETRLARARQDGYNQGLSDATTNHGAARYTSWLITAVGGFLNFELFPGFSFAGLFGVLISILLAIAFLRYFSGG